MRQKKTLKETNRICNRLKSDFSSLKSELAVLQMKLADSETGRAQSHFETNDLRAKLVAAEADRELLLAEMNDLRAKVVPQEQKSTTTATSKVHKCLHCNYVTMKSNRMKTHQAEGCRNATVIKKIACRICNGTFTRNGLRYHLNQYVKKSNHAQNGHQNVTPKEHRKMLEEIKKSNH